MAKNFLLNSKIIIINFLVAILLSANSYAQENESSKSYETNLQKNNDAIEIRMIPKKRKAPQIKNNEDATNKILPESSTQNPSDDEEMVYKKYADELEKVKTELEKQNIAQQNLDANSAQVENPANNANNQERLKKLNEWREEQRKLREERLKKRDEESRNRYKINKERSVIKEIEELNKKNQEALQPKNKTNSINNSSSQLPSSGTQLPSSGTQLPSSGSTIPAGSNLPSSSGNDINPTVPTSPTPVDIPAPSR